MRDSDNTLSFSPQLPSQLTRLSFGLSYRGRRLRAEITADQARYSLLEGPALVIAHHGKQITLTTSEPVSCPIPEQLARETPTQPPGRAPGRPAPA